MISVRQLAAIAMAAGMASTCSAASLPTVNDACKAAFKTNVQPILNTNCVACHQDAAPAGGLSLQRTSALTNLVNVPSGESKLVRVAPGNPQQSYLFRKIAGTHLAAGGSGMQMPAGGKLAANDLKTIETWISGCKGN